MSLFFIETFWFSYYVLRNSRHFVPEKPGGLAISELLNVDQIKPHSKQLESAVFFIVKQTAKFTVSSNKVKVLWTNTVHEVIWSVAQTSQSLNKGFLNILSFQWNF